MFINFSNHASTRWGVPQKQAAKKYGEIVDMQFPNVDPEAISEEVHELARVCAEKIMEMKPECVLCQGEFCLSYQVIQKLKKAGIKVVAACSERKTEEKKIGNDTRKVSYFIFVQFREY